MRSSKLKRHRLSEYLPIESHFGTTANSSLNSTMTLEEVLIEDTMARAPCTGKILEDALVSAKANECLTVGVYESAKVMNV